MTNPTRAAAPTFSADALNWVRNWSAPLAIRCGGFDAPPDPPFTASLHPFTTFTKLDYEGYPNWRDKRLESNLSLGPEGWTIGYEDGEFVAAGEFQVGRKLRWELGGHVANATHADTFIEFVAEPAPRVGVYDGPDRLRCLSGALGETWTGVRGLTAWFEVAARGARAFGLRGELALDFGHGPGFSRRFDVALANSRYDAFADDALWQLRWRIDRLANLEQYDATYQVHGASNGVGTERELVVTRAAFRGL